MDWTLCEIGQAETRQRAIDDFVAMTAFLEPSMVGVGAHLEQTAKFEGEEFGEVRPLGKVGDAAAAEARRFAGDQHFARADRRESGKHAEDSGFAGAVGADERGAASAGNFKGRIMEGDRSVKAGGRGELLGRDGDTWASVRLLRRVGNGGQDGEGRLAEAAGERGDDAAHFRRAW